MWLPNARFALFHPAGFLRGVRDSPPIANGYYPLPPARRQKRESVSGLNMDNAIVHDDHHSRSFHSRFSCVARKQKRIVSRAGSVPRLH